MNKTETNERVLLRLSNIRQLSQPTFYGGVAAEVMHSYWNIPIC